MQIDTVALERVWEIRQQVLWPDKDIGYVKLANDNNGQHYGIYVNDAVVSVISLFQEKDEIQFRKFATLPEFQGRGYGSALLQFTLELARKQGTTKIWCNARVEKVGFYEKFELRPAVDFHEKDGVTYVIMYKELK